MKMEKVLHIFEPFVKGGLKCFRVMNLMKVLWLETEMTGRQQDTSTLMELNKHMPF